MEIVMIIAMIIGVLVLPSSKKTPIKKYDDRVIDFVAGHVQLRDPR